MANTVFHCREKDTAKIPFTISDEAGVAIPLVDLATLTVTVYDLKSGAIINSRSATNIKNTNGGVYDGTSGSWTMVPADNAITAALDGQEEVHVVLFEFVYLTTKRGSTELSVYVRKVAKRTT